MNRRMHFIHLVSVVVSLFYLAYSDRIQAETIVVRSSVEAQHVDRKVISVSGSQQLSPSSLRCWQEGVLLFEEINLSMQDKKDEPALSFAFDDRNQQLYLMKIGDASCMYRSSLSSTK